ncbi:MAG: MFS transporter [Acetobacteraceae bacterium]
MSQSQAAAIAARLDRLPASRHVWRLVVLISFGGCFEFYDLFFTGYVAPGLIRGGFFTPASLGPFAALGLLGAAGFGTFVFATFAGLFLGTIAFGYVADRFGRRLVFTASLLWYSAASIVLAFQTSGEGLVLWRFIAGIGIGVELVTIDTFIAELIPARDRGRAFAVNQFITFLAVPFVAFLAWVLVPLKPLGLDGWRWVVLFGASGALFVWFIQRMVPESPRWLALHGRLVDAERETAALEAAVAAETGGALPAPEPHPAAAPVRGSLAEIFRPPYGARTRMLSVFNFFQVIGFYGFAAWAPTLLIAEHITVTASLRYAFIIAIANPFGPLLGTLIADRVERKWQIVGGAFGMAVFMLLFVFQRSGPLVILCGVLFTLCANIMSFAYHGYQAELFPTRIRARAVGFVYSWSRVSAAFAGLLIGFFLAHGGTISVALFIAFSMAMVILTVARYGPLTRGRPLEEVSP